MLPAADDTLFVRHACSENPVSCRDPSSFLDMRKKLRIYKTYTQQQAVCKGHEKRKFYL